MPTVALPLPERFGFTDAASNWDVAGGLWAETTLMMRMKTVGK
jgi:hypothetical protein